MRTFLPITVILILSLTSAVLIQYTNLIVTRNLGAFDINSPTGSATRRINAASGSMAITGIEAGSSVPIRQDDNGEEMIILPATKIQIPLETPGPHSLALIFNDIAITNLTLVFKDPNTSRDPRIIRHGKLTAADLTQGSETGSPPKLSGRLDIPVGSNYNTLLFEAKIKCGTTGAGQLYLHSNSPRSKNFSLEIINIFSSSDCADSKVIQREVMISHDHYF